MAFFLGVDGGGSKTECAVGDESSVLGRATAASCKIQAVGEEAARAALQQGIRQACAAAGIEPGQLAGVCIGVSGYSRAGVGAALTAMVAELTSACVEVVGDNAIAMEAAFGRGPGVLVISGTGSIAFGRDAQGREARVGGWGPAISDEGSGNWIGRHAVAAMMRAADRRETTALQQRIVEFWAAPTLAAVASIANQQALPQFAALFPVVLDAARAGDKTASGILSQAGEQLAALAADVIQSLWQASSGNKVSVRVTGGVFASSDEVRRAFEHALRVSHPEVEISLDVVEPVLGALAMARRTATKMVAHR